MGTDGDTFSKEIPFLKLRAIARLVKVQRLFRISVYVRESLNIGEISGFLNNVNTILQHASCT